MFTILPTFFKSNIFQKIGNHAIYMVTIIMTHTSRSECATGRLGRQKTEQYAFNKHLVLDWEGKQVKRVKR